MLVLRPAGNPYLWQRPSFVSAIWTWHEFETSTAVGFAWPWAWLLAACEIRGGEVSWHAEFLMDDFMGQWMLWNNYDSEYGNLD